MSRKIRPLVLSHTSELWGGAERSLLEVFDRWVQRFGIQPEFILRAPVLSYGAELEKRGWKFHAVEYSFWLESEPPTTPADIRRKAEMNRSAVAEIARLIRATSPDVVMTNSIVCPWAALAAHACGVPHIWFVREHGDESEGRVLDIGQERTFEDVDRLSRLVVATTTTLADHIARSIDRSKVAISYNPIDLVELRRRAAEKCANPFREPGSLKLVLTGNIEPSKGQLEAVHAVHRLLKEGHGVEMCIVGRQGDRTYGKRINAAIAELGITGKVIFAGERANPLPFAALADVGVMPSRKEAFGRVTLEYLAAGKPVVGFNTGGTPELVHTGINGYLVESGDVDGLAEALRNYANDRALIAQHGAASKEIAERIANTPHNVEALYERITALLDEPHVPSDQPINYLRYWEEILGAE